MTTENETPTTPAPGPLNPVGEWIVQAHANERVVTCILLRAMHAQMVEMLTLALSALPDTDDSRMIKEAAPQLTAQFLENIVDIENGAHFEREQFEGWLVVELEIAGKWRKFGIPPNETAMATDPACVVRPWTDKPGG